MDVLDTLVSNGKTGPITQENNIFQLEDSDYGVCMHTSIFIHRHNLCGYVWRSVHTCMGEYISIWVYVHMHARMYTCGDIGIISMMAF